MLFLKPDFHFPPIIKQFLNRTMSLIRKASKATLRLTTEDFSACMDQKNGIISSLQYQVEGLRTNQQKYDRVKEQLAKAKAKLESLLRDHDNTTSNNQERLELSYRNVNELRIQAEHLQQELKLKGQALKEAKFNTQQLISFENRKEDQATEIKIKFQEQRSLAEVRKMEEERTRLQIAQIKEEVEKGRRENGLIKSQNDTVNEKCYKTQGYIRSLMREETNLNESLSRIQDENNKLDAGVSELDTVVSLNQGQISSKEKDCQELRFKIASKELEKKKMENEIREKVKLLSSEKEKWKSLCEQWEQKKAQANRIEAQVNQASSEINFIISKNNEIVEINEQLSDDLKVCQRHLENVARVNKSMQTEIQQLHDTNLKAITKLQDPFTNRTNISNFLPSGTGKWGTTSRATDFQTGDFDKKTYR